MNFGEAITCMKKGKKATRNAWKENFQPNWTPTQEDMLAEDWEMFPAEETVVDETPNMTADAMIDLKNRIGRNIKFYSTGETIISEHMDYQKLLTGAESTYTLSFAVPKKVLMVCQ